MEAFRAAGVVTGVPVEDVGVHLTTEEGIGRYEVSYPQ